MTDWDGATEALRKDALRGVQPPLESIVPGAPGSRWKLADELVGIVTDQNYKGHLDARGYPKEWDVQYLAIDLISPGEEFPLQQT